MFESLNIGRSVGDDSARVQENCRIIKDQVGAELMINAHQVHGDTVAIVGREIDSDSCVGRADGLLTDRKNVALMVKLADCQGILLHDPDRSVIGAVHCGWRGSVAGIILKTVDNMASVFSSDPAGIRAWISPSLGPCCGEFVHYKKELPPEFHRFQVKPNYFDFWEISKSQLIEAGLTRTNIDIAGICTCCSDDYFSYRRACRESNGVTGRQCAVISLP